MTQKEKDNLLRKHLQSRPKEELIERLMEYAPDHYRKAIELLGVTPKKQEENLERVKQSIENLHWGAYSTYERIDQMLIIALTRLRPFWKTHPTEVIAIYRDVAVSMHNAQEDGVLYDRMEDVYMETGWPSEVLDFLDELNDDQHDAAIKELTTIRESLEWISAAYVVDGA